MSGLVDAAVRSQAFGSRREWSRELAVSAGVGLFLGLAGPFGSYLEPSLLSVVAYWIGALLLGALLFGLIVRPVIRLFLRARSWWALVLPVCAVLVAALPLSVACHVAAMTLWPDAIRSISRLEWFGETLVISYPAAIAYWLCDRSRHPFAGRTAACASVMSAQPSSSASFLARLPPHLGCDLLALQMEDHYVRAHTSRGSALVLVPLRQAITELTGIEGLRVHRSWWVARSAVEEVMQDGRNLRLLLSNGTKAPVSRSNLATARAAGLLARRTSSSDAAGP